MTRKILDEAENDKLQGSALSVEIGKQAARAGREFLNAKATLDKKSNLQAALALLNQAQILSMVDAQTSRRLLNLAKRAIR